MSRANLNAFTAASAFLNIEDRYRSLFVPGYRFVLTDIKALAAVCTAGVTLLPARDIP